ncbi:hypothetical protein PRIPAC_96224 [Pristionchus pacificus]|uniref:G protein-coupled receptor n=1 Tax=Pristionchus pacificus TaxID=54126 RepID=A0A8R1UAL9_PRIPA|nr:hypothetical protein PRIPAC_96224 [Pristionchus pacificus]|eukprot:PDM84400.1 G protein-coupled receptor [Pristionchus pacificus]
MHTAEEWTVLFGTPRYAFGIWSFAFPTVCQILYIPALRVFYRERRLTCYKRELCLVIFRRAPESKDRKQKNTFQFMFLIALADMGGLCCIGSLFGYVMISGGVYCSNPPLGLIVGSGFWIISSTNCILLVINRMCELTDRAWVFKGWSSSMCMLATIVYGILELLFTRPPLPNSTQQFCDFNPYIPGHTADDYPNHSNMYHDMALAIALPCLFVLLCGIVRSKTDQLSATHSSAAQAIQSKGLREDILSDIHASFDRMCAIRSGVGCLGCGGLFLRSTTSGSRRWHYPASFSSWYHN